jgi:hypothetical protein
MNKKKCKAREQRRKLMENTRIVHKLLSVFDITNYRSILLPYRSSIRVLFEYDVEEKIRNFTILSKDIPEEIRNILEEMLKKNITSDRIIYGLDSNNLDYADIIDKGVWISNIIPLSDAIELGMKVDPMPEQTLMIN